MRSRLSLIAVLSVLGCALLLAAWMLVDARHTAWQHAAETAENMSELLSLNIERALDVQDNILKMDQRRIQSWNGRRPTEAERELVFSTSSVTDAISGIVITDSAGRVIDSNAPKMPIGLSLAVRDVFQMQMRSVEDRMAVGRVVRGVVTGQYGIPLSRRLTKPDGSFNGMVSCLFRLSFFQHVLDHLRLDQNSAVLMVRDGGQLMARKPMWGIENTTPQMLGTLVEPLDRASSGSFEAVSPFDGVNRLYSFHRVGDTPLTVMVATAVSSIYAEWWQRALVSALVGAPLLVAALILGVALSQELERRSAAERDASERSAEFQATFDHAADGLFLLRNAGDGEFFVERANAALAKIWNLPTIAIKGREPRGFLPFELATRFEENWARCVNERVCHSEIFEWNLMDQAATLEIVTTPIADATGAVRHLLCSVRDVTEQAEVVKQLQQAKKLEALGRITAGITHDFNNLLQVLLSGLREIVLRLPPDGRAYLQDSVQAVTHGVALTRRLLNLSRQTITSPRVVDINQSLARLSELMRWTLGNGVKLNIVPSGGVAAAVVDDAKLQLCLLNLASNARDAMPEGGQLSIYARLAAAGEAQQQGLSEASHVVIVVQDTGPGMEPAVRARVFDAFFSTKGLNKGTGLGLWMVRTLIQEAGGDVRIDSEIGCGTRVAIWLPEYHGPDIVGLADAGPFESPSAQREANAAGREAPSQKILLVDDDLLVRQGLTRLLSEAGYDVTSSSNPNEAFGMIKGEGPVDLLIVDQNMAGLSGAALIGLAQQVHPSMPALMITGDLEPGHVPAGAELLHKPIDPDALLIKIKDVLASASEVAI